MVIRNTDNTTIENLNIISCIDNNEIIFYEVYPEEGYVIRTPIFDEIIEDESGKRFLALGYASAMTENASYNWSENPNNYSVEPYEDGIFDKKIEYETTETDYIKALKEKAAAYDILMGASE